MKDDFNSIRVKKNDLHYFILILIITISFFDAHIENITGFKRLPLPEMTLILFALAFVLIKSYESIKITLLNFGILTVLTLSIITGFLNELSILTTMLGVVWLYKSLIALYLGSVLIISETQKNKILKLLFKIAIVSVIFTWIQFFIGGLNPFGFQLASSGIIGIMDNPNKNGFILLFGLLYVTVFNPNKKILYIIFIISILLTQSRQIMILLLFFLFYIYIIVKRNFKIFLIILCSGLILTFIFKDFLFYRFTELSRITDTGNYFRLKAMKIGFQVLEDTYFFGSGPGTFGGIVANLTDSSIHKTYNLFGHWSSYRDATKIPATIDMYWPHLVVETGIFIFTIAVLIYRKIFLRLNENSKNKQTSLILKLLLIVLLFMSIFSMTLEASYSAISIFILIGIDLKLANKNE